MRRILRWTVVVVLLGIIVWLPACDKRRPTFAGHRVAVELHDFLREPDKYVGYHIVVIGLLENGNGNLTVSRFDSGLHPDVPSNLEIMVFDSTPGRWLSQEGKSLEPQCTGHRVAINGELGTFGPQGKVGIIKIETIFLVKNDASSSLGDLCYTSENPEFYQPIVMSD